MLKWADLQGFWDMIKIQADNIDDHFAELDLMRQNGWKELAAHVGLIGQQLQFQLIKYHLYLHQILNYTPSSQPKHLWAPPAIRIKIIDFYSN